MGYLITFTRFVDDEMNNVLVLVDSLADWKPYSKTNSILTVSDYLKYKPQGKDRKLVINLSNDYSYNSEGYYSSLLAQTRGHKVIPIVDIINKVEAGTGIRMDSNLQKICYQWIQKNNIRENIWYLNVYFRELSCTFIKVAMNTHSKNQIENIQFLSLNQLSVEEEDHFADALDLFSKRVWCAPQIADIPDIMIIEQIYHDGADALYMQLSLS